MAGYTRQSSFADGDTITAALFNDEYNQLVNAFSNTTGHSHDGTAASGPVIGLIGDAGETSPNNKVLIDTTNNYIEFYVEVSSNPVQQLYIADGAIVPVTDSDVDLGTSSLYFKDSYIDTVTTTGNVSVGGNLTVTGNATISGNLTFGDADTDSINLAAEIDSNVIPNTDNTYDLGSSTKEWKDIYIDGTAYLDAINFNGTAITSTAAELNILDGVTATATEINLLDGVTATTSELNILDGVTATAAEINALDGITSTVTELNIVDGSTAATSTTLADADRVVVNDNGTMVQVALTDFETYFESALDTLSNVTTVGALNSGSITSGFGSIDNGSSAITTTGTITYGSLSDGTITITAFVDEDNMVSNSATLVPTQQSVKAYVDSQVTAQDLDFQGDSGGALSIDLDSETLTIAGGTGIDTSGALNTLTVAIDSTVATLTGSQTLTNKTLTSPVISSISNTGTLTLPTSTDTLVGRATTDTLTNKTLTSPVINTGVSGTAVLDDDTFATATATTLATSESIKAYVDAQILTEDTLAELNDTNITTPAGGALLFYDATTTNWIDNVVSGDITITSGGVATIAAGSVENSMLAGSIANAKLANSTVSYGGVSVALGASDATPAFNLSDATAYPGDSSLVTTGALNSGSITSGFGSIDVGASAITTTGTVTGGTLAGTLSTAAQTNITSVGTLSSLTVSGDVTIDTSTLKVDSTNNRVGIGNASPDVSLDLGSNTDSIHVPVGTTAQRPSSPAAGYFRYNSTTGGFEGYTTEWGAIAGSGSGASGSAVDQNTYTGDGSTTAFTLAEAPTGEDNTIVFIDGVYQDDSTYSVSGTTLTFSTAPANSRVITVYTITSGILGTAPSIDTMTGDGSDTTLTLSISPASENATFVTIDGVVQHKDTYSVSGTTLTFSAAPPNGSAVECISFANTTVTTTKLIQDADEDTKIQVEESSDEDKIRFDVGGSEKAIIDSTGLGIGTSSPTVPLQINHGSSSVGLYTYGSYNYQAKFESSDSEAAIVIEDSGSTNDANRIGVINDVMTFTANNSERIRIHSNGTVSIGTTATNSAASLNVATSSIDNANVGVMSIRSNDSGETASECIMSLISYRNDSTTSNVFVKFAINQYNSGNGQINANGGGQVAFGSFSDSRLKENITDLPSQLDNIVALQPKEFDYIESEGGGHQIGFVAQDVEEIYPDLVGEREDGMKTLSGMSKMEARLISAIKELKTELDAAKARIETLENA